MDFLNNLSYFLDDLTLREYEYLEFCGVNLDFLYPDDFLNIEYLDSLRYYNDPRYIEHTKKNKKKSIEKVKSKKTNEMILSKRNNPLYKYKSNKVKNQ